MVTIYPAYKTDYENYKDHIRNRRLLFETKADNMLENTYRLLFIFSTTSNICQIDTKSKINYFYNEVKNNLIIAFDLINMNYLNSANQILRSAIESFFRLSLSLSRYVEYRENKKRQIYSATETLKNLKSMADTHGIWKMTSFTMEYFKDTPLFSTIENLVRKYTTLSGNVHVNTTSYFTVQEYLSDYVEFDFSKSQDAINLFNIIIIEILVSTYYLSHLLQKEEVYISKRDIQTIEAQDICNVKKKLNEIDYYFQL